MSTLSRGEMMELGVEGMMLFGAAVGYWVTQSFHGGNATLLAFAVLGAALAGAAMAAIHAFLTITMRANQIVSGLALTIFAGGLGLSAYFGNELHLADKPPAPMIEEIAKSYGIGVLPSGGFSSVTATHDMDRNEQHRTGCPASSPRYRNSRVLGISSPVD